jgi:hypothetical protein
MGGTDSNNNTVDGVIYFGGMQYPGYFGETSDTLLFAFHPHTASPNAPRLPVQST